VGHAEEVDLEKVADSLIGGEKSHNNLACEKRTHAVPIFVLDDIALTFEPNPVNGKNFGSTGRAKVP